MTGIRHISKFMISAIAASALASCGGTDTEERSDTSSSIAQTGNIERPVVIASEAERVTAPVIEEPVVLNMTDEILGVDLPIIMSGTEPFWSGSFEGGWITLDRPGLPLIEVPIPELPDAGNGRMRFNTEGLDITLATGGCEAADSELSVTVLFEDAEYVGCAGMETTEIRDGGDLPLWYQLVPGSIEAIDACLEAADGPRFVRALYPREQGTVGMILVDGVGRYEECGAEVDTGELGFFDPVSPEQAAVWFDGDVMFARADSGTGCNIQLSSPLDASLGQFHPKGCR